MKTHLKALLPFLFALTLVGCSTAAGPNPSSSSSQQVADRDEIPASPSTSGSAPDAIDLMQALISEDRLEVLNAQALIRESGDPRFIPVMIEMMRASQIGLVEQIDQLKYVRLLESLSGQEFGNDWPAWIEWYGGTDLEPPAGFTGWKGRLLGRIDPGFAEFLSEEAPSRIRVEEILWGGVRVDGIPALDNPDMLPAEQADYLLPEEPVFGLYVSGEARAYPLRILDWHEMANDLIGGQPVSLTYCTLCGAAIAYDGQASDGQTYTFGSSGFLYRSNKLMYDRQTRTLWNQFTGEPVLGDLAASDLQLDLLPVVLTTWDEWKTRHPDTLVVALDTGYQRAYLPGAAYGHYFSSDETMFPVSQRSDLLEAKAQIFALRFDGIAKAYPLDTLLEERIINDIVGDTDVVLVASGERVIVEGQSLRAGEVTYSPGVQVRAYVRDGHTFQAGADQDEILDLAGGQWRATETALVGPDGERLERLGGHLAYWFGWYAFFPNTEVYGLQ